VQNTTGITHIRITDIHFYENSSSGNRVVSYGLVAMTKLIAAFRNFANAAKNGTLQGWSYWVPVAQTPQRCVGRGVGAIIEICLMKRVTSRCFNIVQTAEHVQLEYWAAIYSSVWNLIPLCTCIRLVGEWLRSPNLICTSLTRQTVLP